MFQSGARLQYLTHEHSESCMKDGMIKEVGTHEELMNIAHGEYAKLYNIQASAFIESPPTVTNDESVEK